MDELLAQALAEDVQTPANKVDDDGDSEKGDQFPDTSPMADHLPQVDQQDPANPNNEHNLPVTGTGDDAFVKFQLIPISETPGKSAIGTVLERKLKLGETIKIGRQIVRDGQATIKGNKKATDIDIWFTSKVVSRLHAEIWTKDGQALKSLMAAANPYGHKDSDPNDTSDTECCICLGAIAPYQALFISPCSHTYHFKCVSTLISTSPMFQCPLCRQVANLTASVSCSSLHGESNNEPLPILEEELKPPEPPVTTRTRGASMGRRTSIKETFGLLTGARHSTARANQDAGEGPSLQRKVSSGKKTFGMKLSSFLGRNHGEPAAAQESNPEPSNSDAIPRVTAPLIAGAVQLDDGPELGSSAPTPDERNRPINSEN
ncbi:hypothetical protein HDV02_001257 [Globomyces sp. JEL0801]|nr:hypothetical protein HDV02_001257 [Globomyces sp. JEL0801]